MPKLYFSEKGQTLVFVLLVMTIALAIGISISSRTISTIRRTTNIDTSSRASAAAEAAIEYYLSRPTSELENILSGISNCLPSNPRNYPGGSGNTLSSDVQTNAIVVINRYGCLNPGESYTFDVNQDEVLELKTDNGGSTGTLNFNFKKSSGSSEPSLYLLEIYGNSPSYNVRKVGYNMDGSYSNGFSTATGGQFSYTLGSNPRILRILSLYNSSSVTVTPVAGGSYKLPYQGYKITATGQVAQEDSSKRVVSASKSLSHLPALFNFAIFSNSSSQNLD